MTLTEAAVALELGQGLDAGRTVLVAAHQIARHLELVVLGQGEVFTADRAEEVVSQVVFHRVEALLLVHRLAHLQQRRSSKQVSHTQL